MFGLVQQNQPTPTPAPIPILEEIPKIIGATNGIAKSNLLKLTSTTNEFDAERIEKEGDESGSGNANPLSTMSFNTPKLKQIAQSTQQVGSTRLPKISENGKKETSTKKFNEQMEKLISSKFYDEEVAGKLDIMLQAALKKARTNIEAIHISSFRETIYQFTSVSEDSYPNFKLQAVYGLIEIIEAGHSSLYSNNGLLTLLNNLTEKLDSPNGTITSELMLAYGSACLAAMELMIEFDTNCIVKESCKKIFFRIFEQFKKSAKQIKSAELLLVADSCIEAAKMLKTEETIKDKGLKNAALIGEGLKNLYDKDLVDFCKSFSEIYSNAKKELRADWYKIILKIKLFIKKNKVNNIETLEMIQKVLADELRAKSGEQTSWKFCTSCLQIIQKIILHADSRAEEGKKIIRQGILGKKNENEEMTLPGLFDFVNVRSNDLGDKYKIRIYTFAIKMVSPLAFLDIDPNLLLQPIRNKLINVRDTNKHILELNKEDAKPGKVNEITINLEQICKETDLFVKKLFKWKDKEFLRSWSSLEGEPYFPEVLFCMCMDSRTGLYLKHETHLTDSNMSINGTIKSKKTDKESLIELRIKKLEKENSEFRIIRDSHIENLKEEISKLRIYIDNSIKDKEISRADLLKKKQREIDDLNELIKKKEQEIAQNIKKMDELESELKDEQARLREEQARFEALREDNTKLKIDIASLQDTQDLQMKKLTEKDAKIEADKKLIDDQGKEIRKQKMEAFIYKKRKESREFDKALEGITVAIGVGAGLGIATGLGAEVGLGEVTLGAIAAKVGIVAVNPPLGAALIATTILGIGVAEFNSRSNRQTIKDQFLDYFIENETRFEKEAEKIFQEARVKFKM